MTLEELKQNVDELGYIIEITEEGYFEITAKAQANESNMKNVYLLMDRYCMGK
jgi:hypothetical protein